MVFTLAEVAQLLQVDRRRLDRLERLGVLLPQYRPRRRGDSTLYTVRDVFLLTVLLRLEDEGVSYAGRAVFAAKYGDAVKVALDAPGLLVVVSDRKGPRLVDRQDRHEGAAVRFSLAPLADAVLKEAQARRADTFGEVWAGWRLRPGEEVAAELALT